MTSFEDEQSIHKLVSRYADAVNRRDEAAWRATWADNGVWYLPGRDPAEGVDNVVAQWTGAMARIEWVVQLIYNGVVDVDGDTATGTWYLCEHLRFGADTGMFNIGCYQDRYTKAAGDWRFLERRYTVLYNDGGAGDGSIATAVVPPPPWRG